MKQDGSLSNSAGVEIVSHPMTYKYIIETDDWKTLFDKLNKYEMNNTNSCGLHFHLDRKYFEKKDISVIDYIINNFSDYFTKIGGRPLNDYCAKSYKRDDQWGEDIVSRYHTVNLENSETIELRFCQSTYQFDVFLERLKMIFAIADFAKSHTLSECFGLDTMQNFEKEFEKYYDFSVFLNISKNSRQSLRDPRMIRCTWLFIKAKVISSAFLNNIAQTASTIKPSVLSSSL